MYAAARADRLITLTVGHGKMPGPQPSAMTRCRRTPLNRVGWRGHDLPMTNGEAERWHFGGRWYTTTLASDVHTRDGMGLET